MKMLLPTIEQERRGQENGGGLPHPDEHNPGQNGHNGKARKPMVTRPSDGERMLNITTNTSPPTSSYVSM